MLVRRGRGNHVQHHGIQQILDVQTQGLVNKALGIAGAGQVLFENLHPKAVVDALEQDAAQFQVAVNHQHVGRAVLFGGNCRRQPAGASANHNHVI